jgi:SPP1 family phage portal protein
VFYRIDHELTENDIKVFIDDHRKNYVPRLIKLENYYRNKNKILNREFEDESKPNNKIAHNYAAYITDTLVPYMLGNPVTYTSEDVELLDRVKDILNYNDSEDCDIQLAENQSIYGIAFELMYIDSDKEIRFKPLDTKEVILVYGYDESDEVKYAIRYYDRIDLSTSTRTTYVEVYTDKSVQTWKSDAYLANISIVNTTLDTDAEEKVHSFKAVPINIYANNNFFEGDYEKIISLIDAYDTIVSDGVNELDYFSDAYLLFANCEVDTDKAQDMKNNRIIQAISGDNQQAANVSWLTKNAEGTEQENTKKRIVDEIHKLSKVPNLDPSAFVSHTTAAHVYYSLLATENLVSKKVKKFKKGLQQRLEKMMAVMGTLNLTTYDYRIINITFNRNIPQALETIADPVSKLRGLVSDETLLALIPGVTDVKSELEKVREQNKLNMSEEGFGDTNE